MPSSRNPSLNLTDDRIDDIVDRLLLGKYEKHRPVVMLEAIRTGLLSLDICREYVRSRWSMTLTRAGITMRSNKLWERMVPHISSAQETDNNELVWKVYDNRSYETICYAVGSRAGARQWAWTLFGWTMPPGSEIMNIRTELSGGGGIITASSMNMDLVNRLKVNIKSYEDRAALQLASAERLRGMIDAVTGAAAHLISGAIPG
jgi:hypothetical protein